MALSTTQYGYIIDPMVPFTDDKGKTIKNGFVRVFVAGSSTPVVTYRNFDGATNQDRIELDNSGRTKTGVIGSKGLTYKVCVYDKHHSQESPILTVDKVSVIGANITAGTGATVVTGLDGLTTKPDGFVDASVIGTDGYVALDHTLVTDDLDTDAKATAVENDRYIPLLNDDVNDPDSKITLKRLKQWVHNDNVVIAGTIYPTLQDAIADAANLAVGNLFETNGFHTSGDGGAARYLVSDTGTANGMDIVQLATGKLAVLQVQDFAYPDQFGYVRNDNSSDVVPFINRIFATGILHIKLHWGRYYMRQTLNMPIASSIEGVARAAYDYPAMSRMLYMVNTGTCAINASNYDVCLENFDLYCSGSVSGKIGILTNSYDNAQRGLAFRNLKISGFETSVRLEASANWNILFDRVTFENAQYGVYLNSSKLAINLSDCFFNGVYEECVHDCIYSSALSFSHCNFGCRKRVYKKERSLYNWKNFGEASFFGCNFEVDTNELDDVAGCFVDVDDGCQLSLTFVGCDFNADKGDPASLTCFKFGDISSAKFIGCHGKESKYVHYDGDFFDPNYPPEARPGSLFIDANCVGLKKPTYDMAHSMSCIDERELYQSYTRVNALNLFDKDYADYSYAGVRDSGGGVLEFFTPTPPQAAATLVIDVPAYFRNRTLTISAPTGTHNKWIVVSTPTHPDQDRTQTPTLLADTYSTADNRDYASFNMNGDRYLTFYYYLMNSDGEPEKFAMSEDLMLSDGNYHYPYVPHIIVEKRGVHINEDFIAPVKITGRSGAIPLSSCDDLVPNDTGLKIFGEVNTFGGTSGGLPTGFSGIGTLESIAMVNFTRCLQILFGGNSKIYTRRAIRNSTSDPWLWQSWYAFEGTAL